jgi:hypothetical protein
MSQSTTRGSRLSRPLSVIGLVGFYPTNNLIETYPIRRQFALFRYIFLCEKNFYKGLQPVSRNYPFPRIKLVCYY